MTIALIPFGAFGGTVAGHLADQCSAWAPHSAGCDVVSAVVVAGAISLSEAAAVAEPLCAADSLPWLPVLIEPGELSVGPWIGPPGVCVECFAARRAQHDGSSGSWPSLPQHARIAAGLVSARFAELLDRPAGQAAAGAGALVQRYRLGGWAISTHPVIARDGCGCRGASGRRTGERLFAPVGTIGIDRRA